MQKIREYNVPTKWSDITIEKLYKLNDLLGKISDSEDYDDELVYSNMFGIFCDTKPLDYYKLDLSEVLKFKSYINFILTTKIPEEQYKNHFKFGKYIFKVKDFNKFTFGEYVDSQHLAGSEGSQSVVKMLSIMVDVYHRRRFLWDKKLDLSIDEKEKIIGSLPATRLIAMQTFFLRGQKRLGRNIVSYLKRVERGLYMRAISAMVGRIMYGFKMRVERILLKWKLRFKFRLGKF